MYKGALFTCVVCFVVPTYAQSPPLFEPPEFPSVSPGPGATHDGTSCFLLAQGTVTPGDVDWVQVSIPWASVQTVVDVDFPAGAGGSALLAARVGGSSVFNISDNNNTRDALCGLSGGTTPAGSPADSAVDLRATPRRSVINVGVTGAEDITFTGAHNQTFDYDVWVFLNPILCRSDADCNDNLACTTDSCDTVTGICTNAPQHALCDNGRWCDGAEVCSDTLGCRPGIRPNCDDGVGCTDDTCDETNDRCVHTADDFLCDTGTFCGGIGQCDPVADCQPAAPPACDDGVPCTDDYCDPDLDDCVHVPDDAVCDNGRFCDGAEACHPSQGCVSVSPPDCGDGVACTRDSCDDAIAGCVHQPDDSLCDNGLFCDGAERCDPSQNCVAGPPPTCDDGLTCTADTCDESTARCLHRSDDSACDDGLFCNGIETCDASAGCLGGPAPDCDDGVGCTADGCDETGDTCVHQPDDSRCDNGRFCDGTETCDAVGDCRAGTPPNCDDGVACTRDSCDEATLSCLHATDDAACDDGTFCNGQEVCDPQAGCQAGADPCPNRQCRESDAQCVDCLADTDCGDGDLCNGLETCDPSGQCRPGAPPCGADAQCDPETGECVQAGGVVLDVRPGQCPNPLRTGVPGQLPVSLVAVGAFEVRTIEVRSIRLERADGVGLPVVPQLGPPGPRPVVADVTSPGAGGCACGPVAPDGLPDLTLKFDVEELVQQLRLGRLAAGTSVDLVVTGKLRDGSSFRAGDCVVIARPVLRD
ncbi:MAG: hypothetical protein HY763_06120 [Planctomycetes bacterium]|nr:hypothetical protein [Planctomycetota bacterium]